MSFNKIKFNRQRFNRTSDITVYIQGFIDGYGEISTNIIKVINIDSNVQALSNILSKAIAVLNVDGQFQADNDIYSYLTKVTQVLAELTASGLIEPDTDIVINLSGQFGGEADLIIADPYIQYKLSYIILPTKTLLIDTKTKVVIV